MRIGKALRNLLMRQEQTHMLSTTKCNYMGETYSFSAVTSEEIDEMVMSTLKIINKKTWLQTILGRLKL